MLINKKSWHYRYITTLYSEYVVNDCANLCEYIRKFISTTIFYVFSIGFLVSIGAAILRGGFNLPRSIVAWACLPVGAITFGTICGLIYLICILNEKRVQKKMKNVKVDPSPFVQYIKDKHNKMCSFIEFKE